MPKKSVLDLHEMKRRGEKITWLTGYDYPTALFEEQAGVDMILVGDSLGVCVYGYPGTVPVTMDQCTVHSEAVRRGAPETFVVGDMPFMSYQVSNEHAVLNAGRFLKEAGVDAVKLEGGVRVLSRVKVILEAGIVVCGHIGLTPQSSGQLGGDKAQGRTLEIFHRVGGGDSFASGLIYGLLSGFDLPLALEYGAAHGALAMTTPGDTSMATLAEVEALMRGAGARVVR